MNIQYTRGRLGVIAAMLESLREEADRELRRVSVTCHDDHDDAPEWQEIRRNMLQAVASMITARDAASEAQSQLYKQLPRDMP